MISLLKIGISYYNPNRKEYLIDGADDVAGLPTSNAQGSAINGTCAPGSLAYTPDLQLVYMLGNDDQWYEVAE